MQFPRYELSYVREPVPRRASPRSAASPRPRRSARAALARLSARRRHPRLTTHEYLELEFIVGDRR